MQFCQHWNAINDSINTFSLAPLPLFDCEKYNEDVLAWFKVLQFGEFLVQ